MRAARRANIAIRERFLPSLFYSRPTTPINISIGVREGVRARVHVQGVQFYQYRVKSSEMKQPAV